MLGEKQDRKENSGVKMPDVVIPVRCCVDAGTVGACIAVEGQLSGLDSDTADLGTVGAERPADPKHHP